MQLQAKTAMREEVVYGKKIKSLVYNSFKVIKINIFSTYPTTP
jgi:hypothetical protein